MFTRSCTCTLNTTPRSYVYLLWETSYSSINRNFDCIISVSIIPLAEIVASLPPVLWQLSVSYVCDHVFLMWRPVIVRFSIFQVLRRRRLFCRPVVAVTCFRLHKIYFIGNIIVEDAWFYEITLPELLSVRLQEHGTVYIKNMLLAPFMGVVRIRILFRSLSESVNDAELNLFSISVCAGRRLFPS